MKEEIHVLRFCTGDEWLRSHYTLVYQGVEIYTTTDKEGNVRIIDKPTKKKE